MTNLDEHNLTIRQYLLGLLIEEQSESIEERVFAEPAFSEQVQVVEEELLYDYWAGELSSDERSRVEARYGATLANRSLLAFEETFGQLIHTKQRAAVEAQRSSSRSDSLMSPIRRRASWYPDIFLARPVFAYATIAMGLLLISIGVWYMAAHRQPSPDAAALARRKAIETHLAQLNTPSRPHPNNVVTAALQPVQRHRGVMVRLAPGPSPSDQLIEFRVQLTQARSENYRAIFLDDRRRQLFTISNLATTNSANGPQLLLFVPFEYLPRGDYEIDLSFSGQNGDQESDSYAFRVVENK